MRRVLLVEDDRNLRESLAEYLRGQGFEVTAAGSLAEARTSVATAEVVVLDWMLPDGEGLDFVRALRESGRRLPVIFLTARGELVDRVVGLESGAQDYMTKPFEPRELVARLRVQLREHGGAAPVAAIAAPAGDPPGSPLTMDDERHEVRREGELVELSRKEYQLLKLFMDSPGRVFSREEILNQVWGYDRYPSTRTVDTHVLQLRQKLGDELIETVRGVGYRFRPPEGES